MTDDGELVLKFANAAFEPQPVKVALGGAFPAQDIRRTVLADRPDAKNTPEDPRAVVPHSDRLPFAGGRDLPLVLPPCSVTVLRMSGM